MEHNEWSGEDRRARPFCEQHSGNIKQMEGIEGKLSLLLWISGISSTAVIGLVLVVTAYLYGSIGTLNTNYTTMNLRIDNVESSVKSIIAKHEQQDTERFKNILEKK